MGAVIKPARTQLRRTTRTVTFSSAAGLGRIGGVDLFRVTGEVWVAAIVPYCSTDLAGASATIALGVVGNTALLIAATTGTDIDTDKFWQNTAPAVGGELIPAALKDVAITADIIATVATADLTGGVIRFDIYWLPLSSDGNVIAAAGTPYFVGDTATVTETVAVAVV